MEHGSTAAESDAAIEMAINIASLTLCKPARAEDREWRERILASEIDCAARYAKVVFGEPLLHLFRGWVDGDFDAMELEGRVLAHVGARRNA